MQKSKKRNIKEVAKKRRTLKRNLDQDEEDAIERGGSSQDKFESDFIDDDEESEDANPKSNKKK